MTSTEYCDMAFAVRGLIYTQTRHSVVFELWEWESTWVQEFCVLFYILIDSKFYKNGNNSGENQIDGLELFFPKQYKTSKSFFYWNLYR